MDHQLSADDVKSAIDAAAAQLPELQVVITTNHMTYPWHIDLNDNVIYVDGVTHPDHWPIALSEALTALTGHYGLPAPPQPDQHLRLVDPMPPGESAPAATTGTHGR